MKININFILTGVILMAIVFCYVLLSNRIPKVAYVELETIYDKFPMKKELESKLINVQQARKLILDSLKIKLNTLSLSIKSEKDVEGIQKLQINKQEYLMKQKSFEEDNETTTQNYTAQIWKQINQYIKDYGKQKQYTLIIGAEGSGALLYGDDSKDITTEVTKYLNERYNGSQK